MHTCNDYLYTWDMQFGFNPQHSTTMCRLVYHEIIICQIIVMFIVVYSMLVRLLTRFIMENYFIYIIESKSSVLYYTFING